jgi:hypothetical protein
MRIPNDNLIKMQILIRLNLWSYVDTFLFGLALNEVIAILDKSDRLFFEPSSNVQLEKAILVRSK